MTDPKIQVLASQVQTNAVQIQAESNARVVADDTLSNRIGSLEAILTDKIKEVIRAELEPGGLLHRSR